MIIKKSSFSHQQQQKNSIGNVVHFVYSFDPESFISGGMEGNGVLCPRTWNKSHHSVRSLCVVTDNNCRSIANCEHRGFFHILTQLVFGI